MNKIIFKLASIALIVFLIVSCKTRNPVIIREKEYIIITNYCKMTDFIHSTDDILNSSDVSLISFSFNENDSIITEIKLNKNKVYSPDNQYYIEYQFIPSQDNLSVGTCNAIVYTKDTVLVSIIKNVRQHEKVLWFKDFLIFEGFGNEFSRKIVLDLTTGFSKELNTMGYFDLIGKSPSYAFYKSTIAGASIGGIKLISKYSVVKLSKDEIIQVHEPSKNFFTFLYNENTSIFYNSVTDSFSLFLNQNLEYSFKSSAIDFPFDESSYDSVLYVFINYGIYKTTDEFSLISTIKPRTNNKLDFINEIRVLKDKIFFETLHEITNNDCSPSGIYTTKNNVTFNIHDANRIYNSESLNHFVSEFGILDLNNKSIYYPRIKIVN